MIKVLIIDDDEITTDMMRHYLTQQGMEVIVENVSVNAFDRLYNEMPDIVILDFVMPDKDGIELCKEIRDNPKTANIPVIFITSSENESDVIKAVQFGVSDYLAKPFSMRDLAATVLIHDTLAVVRKVWKPTESKLNHYMNEYAETP